MRFGNGARFWKRVGVVLVAAWLLAAAAQAQPKAATPTAKPTPAAAKASASKAAQAAAKATPASAKATPAPAKDASATAPASAAARATSTTVSGLPTTPPAPMGQASPDVVALLERITQAHGAIKTLTVEFDQEKHFTDTDATEKIKSNGRVYLQMPGRLRCEYDKPDPSVLLFADKEFYQYVESLAQVDKFSYASEEEARERFRMMLLGFGVSGDQVLSSYNVTQEPADAKEPGTTVLAFAPVHPEIRKVVKRIVVWFDSEKFLPRKVRVEEVSAEEGVSGDVTTVTIRPGTFKINPSIPEKKFRAEWPKKTQVIDH